MNIEKETEKSILNKITSKFILKKVFAVLSKGSMLKILKYNKHFQEMIGIKLQDFKDYSEIIELEIIPVSNKLGKFINISNDNKEYYHIYYNDEQQERNVKTFNGDDDNEEDEEEENEEEKEKIKKIRITIDTEINNFEKLFENCKSIESIYFKRFFRSDITNMRSMFWECESLKEINLDKFKTNEVTNMSWMFYGCKSLEKADISNFAFNKTEKMVGMFWGCKALKNVKMPVFNNDNKTDMKCMFSECSEELKEKIKNGNYNVSNDAFE